jgi:hypothetical protein
VKAYSVTPRWRRLQVGHFTLGSGVSPLKSARILFLPLIENQFSALDTLNFSQAIQFARYKSKLVWFSRKENISANNEKRKFLVSTGEKGSFRLTQFLNKLKACGKWMVN